MVKQLVKNSTPGHARLDRRFFGEAMMIGALRAVVIGLVLAGAVSIGPAAAEKIEISREVEANYQEYLKKIGGFEVAVFAVSEDGNRSFYVWCSESCSLSRLSQEAVVECERRTDGHARSWPSTTTSGWSTKCSIVRPPSHPTTSCWCNSLAPKI
jgi:hypothetical protein